MAEQKKKKSLGWLWGILIGLVLAVSLVISLCIMGLTIFLNIRKPKPGDTQIEVSIADPEKPDKPGKVDKPGKLDGTNDSFSLTDAGRTGLLEYAGYEERKFDYTPSVPSYSVNSDLSNVDNANRFYLDDEEKALLSANGFVVEDYNLSEFFEEYEYNRYSQVSSFVTVDSMMHTYHLYFAMLQKNTELDYLAADLSELSKCMVKESEKAYTALKGTEWESAAKKTLAFYTVGAYLSDNSLEINPAVSDMVNAEISKISAAQGIDTSVITGEYEDYSQYKPRGYYEGNATLESYFRAMMWYGRMNFAQKDEEMNRIALLSTLALSTGEAKEKWEEIYSITSFFAGNSDDLGYYEYLPIIKEIYGDVVTYEKLVGDDESFDEFTGH